MGSSVRMGSGTRNNCVNKRHAQELCVLISSDDETICFTHATSSKVVGGKNNSFSFQNVGYGVRFLHLLLNGVISSRQ